MTSITTKKRRRRKGIPWVSSPFSRPYKAAYYSLVTIPSNLLIGDHLRRVKLIRASNYPPTMKAMGIATSMIGVSSGLIEIRKRAMKNEKVRQYVSRAKAN